MKTVKTKDSVGMILCHDITQIVPNKIKDTAFKKGHVIKEEDIEVLLSLGKDNIFVWEKKEGYLHENDAAERLRLIVGGEGLSFSGVKEGKINFTSNYDGLLKVNKEILKKVNSIDEIVIATLHNNSLVKKGQKLAGTRVIPLTIDENKIIAAEEVAGKEKLIFVKPFKKMRVGVVVTGNEVFYGRIKDSFGPVVISKLENYNCNFIGSKIVPDKPEGITEAILEFVDKGAEMVICTGGMSVDPDDSTPLAIKNTGARIVSYGAPVLPGAMFLLGYIKDSIPVLGLPGCVMYAKTTVFDLVLPRILAGEKVEKEDIVDLGHGGLCLECNVCNYPKCSFGKGW